MFSELIVKVGISRRVNNNLDINSYECLVVAYNFLLRIEKQVDNFGI